MKKNQSTGKMYLGTIDVSKIDKEELLNSGKGTYLDVVIFVNDDNPDMFGNHISIQETQSKQDRAAGKRKTYLGNAKRFIRKSELDAELSEKGYSDDDLDGPDDSLPI